MEREIRGIEAAGQRGKRIEEKARKKDFYRRPSPPLFFNGEEEEEEGKGATVGLETERGHSDVYTRIEGRVGERRGHFVNGVSERSRGGRGREGNRKWIASHIVYHN